MYPVFENGSCWVKVDFHLHTRADKEFRYAGESDRYIRDYGNDSNLLIVFCVQIMPDDFVMQLHRF